LLQLAALQALRRLHPQRCIVATPNGTTETLQLIARRADAVVALAHTPGEQVPQAHGWQHGLGDDDSAILLERCRGNQ
jgi:predicted phosphoribosyltransferase